MKIRIEQDELPESPREWDNLGVMVCFHNRYNLGDKHDYNHEDHSSWDELEKTIQKEENPVVILPLYLYSHGGITISCESSQFRAIDSAGWDWGQVGFIFARREDVLKEWDKKRISKKLREKIKEVLISEVKIYDQFLTGDVWSYIIEDDDGECLDSCWGFYGREYCEEKAQEVIESIKKRKVEEKNIHQRSIEVQGGILSIRKFIRDNREEIDAHIKKEVPNVGRINDEERRLWVLNDYGLYTWARSSGVKI